MKISELEKLNSECFGMSNHELNWRSLLEDSANEPDTEDSWIISMIKKYAVGYCESERIACRPKNNAYAIMFEKDGREFWFHVYEVSFEMEYINCPKCGHYPFHDGWICEKCYYSK